MKRGRKAAFSWIFPECDLLEAIEEFNELEREVWEFLDIPSRGDKLKLWSELDARC